MRIAEDNQETEPEVMDCRCENVNDVNSVEEDDMLKKYKADDCMEETTRYWSDMTEEEHTEQKTFLRQHDGQGLKHEKVITARHDKIGPCRTWTSGRKCLWLSMKKTQKKPIRRRWVDVDKDHDQVEVYMSRYVAMELKHQYGRSNAGWSLCGDAATLGNAVASVMCRQQTRS